MSKYYISNKQNKSTTEAQSKARDEKLSTFLFRLPLLILTSSIVACKPAPISIDGSVFIVTNSGTNFKLGLVEVRAIQKSEALPVLKVEQERTTALSNKLIAEIQTSQQEAEKLATARAKHMSSMRRMNESANGPPVMREYDDSPEILSTKKQLLEARGELLKRAQMEGEQALNLEPAYKKQTENILGMCAELTEVLSGTAVIQSLPAAVSAGKTDADGRFQLILPKGQYVLSARTTRKTGTGHVEQYVWLVELVVPLESTNSVMLSNDNLATSDSLTSALKLGTLPDQCM